MAFTHVVADTLTAPEGALAQRATLTGGLSVAVDEVIAAGAIDTPVNLPLDVSALQSLYIVADQDLTLKTNDTTIANDLAAVSGNVIALAAGVPVVWRPGGYYTNLLTVDVVTFYLTNAGGADANLTVRALVNPTP